MATLGPELFEESSDAYFQATLDLIEQGAAGALPPVPQTAKNVSLELVTRIVDDKMLRRYGDSLAEAFGTSYQLSTAERWEGLERERARSLIDTGLQQVRQQHIATGQPDPLVVSDPVHRVHYSTLGLTGDHPAFEGLRFYIFKQPAYIRLESIDELHLRLGLAAGGIKGRHTDPFMKSQRLSWDLGRHMGILDVLGEVPK